MFGLNTFIYIVYSNQILSSNYSECVCEFELNNRSSTDRKYAKKANQNTLMFYAHYEIILNM